MAMKKIIAICQSGGEFETNDNGLLSYNGGDAYALDLDNQMKLSDFKKELADTFHSSVDGMLIRSSRTTMSEAVVLADLCAKYSIAHGFAYKYKKNDSHRVTAKCRSEGCPWRIYASRSPTTQVVCIKTMKPTHTCEGASVKAGYQSTRGLVRSIIKEKLKVSPNYKPKDIASYIKREYGIQLNYTQAWRAKEMAREQLQGSYKEAYTQLPYFCERIMETNPGSIATFATKEDSSFHRLFISFHASISGFQQGCRPLLFLDSNQLYSNCKGWQITGLPCCHAIAVFESLGRSAYDYCSRYFTSESYRLTYAESILPVPNVEKPVESDLTEAAVTVTPPTKRPPGRPKMKQTGTLIMIKRQVMCSNCKGLGHNKKTCK
ncbi:hypothetical protein Acr_20g0009300 [Actinidia rufa]|uniref:Zinc finger PMZ-type domain-containing protein n=1 Tax=Actinidia rufa TaxID=165716 RepID=A0A7J0GEH0_9ERIC|nr:hypothetical protein Acr_20g0009300 [Actinidia rufa]